MRIVLQLACGALAAVLCFVTTGCQSTPSFSRLRTPNFGAMHVPTPKELLHELKPHRLHRWNRHAPPNRTTQWSVADPIPKLAEAGRND